jgi:fatty-acid peroxygenase
VRRFYPFFPSLIAKVRRDFTWKNLEFKKNTRVIFDLYGTNHDSRLWPVPSQFQPDRFKAFKVLPFYFVPQGVGDHYLHHRCPGEAITVELMKSFSEFLVNRIHFSVPEQDLNLDMSRLPAIPKSHVIISRVERLRIFPDVTA